MKKVLDYSLKLLSERIAIYEKNKLFNLWRYFINAIILTVYLLLAYFSLGFSLRQLSRRVLGAEMQKIFLNRQIAYVNATIIVWGVYLAMAYY